MSKKIEGIPVVLRYFGPSYEIRSSSANCEDALICDLFARHAVHAAMAGHNKRLDPASGWWRSVLPATGQPERFE
jgi:6-phosphofructokinase 1